MKEDSSTGAIVAFDQVTVRIGKTLALDRVSFAVPRGSVYALLGRAGAGKSTAIACLLGERKPESGSACLLGTNSRKMRGKATAKIAVVPEGRGRPGGTMARRLSTLFSRRFRRKGGDSDAGPGARPRISLQLAAAMRRRPELLILDDPALGLDAATRRNLYAELIPELVGRSATVFLTSGDASGIDEIADRIGILKDGRLLVDESTESLKSRFRKITYKNEITDSRIDYGTELDEFDAARVRVRGWGIEAVVTDFTEEKFESFRTKEGVVGAKALPMSLEEIFIELAGDCAAERR